MRAFLLLLLLGVAFGVDTPPSITLGTGAAPIPAGLPPTGAAGGDLGGTYPNPTVTAARFSTPGAIGNTVASTGAFTTLLGSTSITNSALTATRVVFSGTAGLQADDAGLTYVAASDALTVLGSVTVGGLTTGRIVWASTGGLLSSTAGFNFNGTTFTTPNVTNSSLTATRVPYAGTAGLMVDDSGFTRAATALTVDAASDGLYTLGYFKTGLFPGATSTSFYIWNQAVSTADLTTYALSGNADGSTTVVNSATTVLGRIGNVTKTTLTTSAFTFASALGVTISNSTAAGAGTGALVITGGASAASLNISGASTLTGNATFTGREIINTAGSSYLASASSAAIYRTNSGGAAPFDVAGNLVLETPTTAVGGWYFTSNSVNRAIIGAAGDFTANGATAAGTAPAFIGTGTSTITGGVTDGYTTSVRLTPTYSAATALTVTRHNYIDLNNVALAGAGPAAVTDAAVFRFNAAVGTHAALASNGAVVVTITGVGPTGAQTTIQGWCKINVNGTLRYIPFWNTYMRSPRWAEHYAAYLNGHAVTMTLDEYEDECTYCLDAQ